MKFSIFIVILLIVLKNITSTTLEEETECLSFLTRATPPQFLPKDRIKLFEIAAEKVEMLKTWDEENYQGVQTPIYVQSVRQHKFSISTIDTTHLIFLFRNTVQHPTINKELKYFFLAIRYNEQSKLSHYHRVGIMQRTIELALTDIRRYGNIANQFQFKEIWQWRPNMDDSRDIPPNSFVREWVVNAQEGWKFIAYESSLGCRLDAVVTLEDQDPRIVHSKLCRSQAAVEQEVETYLSSPGAAFKLEEWILFPLLTEHQKQEFASLLDKIPQSTLNAHRILHKSSYQLQKACYYGNETGTFAVFLENAAGAVSKTRLLVAARKGNCINNKGLVPTYVKRLLEEDIEAQIDVLLNSAFSLLSEILDDSIRDKFTNIENEIFERGAGIAADMLQLVSFVDMRKNGMYGIYARGEENKNLEGYFFVAVHYDISKGKMCVEFVQARVSKSEDYACEEIKKYSKTRVPILPFRSWASGAELRHFEQIENSFSKIEHKIRHSIGSSAVLNNLTLINAGEVEYNGICGIIGIYTFMNKEVQGKQQDILLKAKDFPASLILPKPLTSISNTQSRKGKEANAETILKPQNNNAFAVAVEIDEFSQQWIVRDTLPICETLEQVEHSVYFYLNDNAPFAPHWIRIEELENDKNVQNIEVIVSQLVNWNKKLENLKSSSLTHECKVLFYNHYIVTMHIYSGNRCQGYFSIASKRANSVELVYLSSILNGEVLCCTMFQYVKNPTPYLEDWILVEDTLLSTSDLPLFKASINLNTPLQLKSKGATLAVLKNKPKNMVEDILERLKNFQFVFVRTICYRNGIKRMGILESILEAKISENIFIAWHETDTGFEIYHWSEASEENIEKFLSNYIRYSWKLSDVQAYQSLSTNVERIIKWKHGSATTKLVKAYEISGDEVLAIYHSNFDGNNPFFGVLARKSSEEVSEAHSEISEPQSSPSNSSGSSSLKISATQSSLRASGDQSLPKSAESSKFLKNPKTPSILRISASHDSLSTSGDQNSPKLSETSNSRRSSLKNSKIFSLLRNSATQNSLPASGDQNSPRGSETSNLQRNSLKYPKILSSLRISATQNSLPGSADQNSPRGSETSNSPRHSEGPSSARNFEAQNSQSALSKDIKSTRNIRVSFLSDKEKSKSKIKLPEINWKVSFVTNNLNTSNDEILGKALMLYYKNPQYGYFGNWIDYTGFNDESILPMLRELEPIIKNFLFGSDVNFKQGHESELYKLNPLKIKVHPQIDRLVLIYMLINAVEKAKKPTVSFLYVAIVTKNCNYNPINVDNYRIIYISEAGDDFELVKNNAEKYIGYDLAFDLRWSTFATLENENTDGLPFEADIRSSVSKIVEVAKLFLSETRTFAGEQSTQYYIYQHSNNTDSFACAVMENNNPAGHIRVSPLFPKVVLECEILNYRRGRRTWTLRELINKSLS